MSPQPESGGTDEPGDGDVETARSLSMLLDTADMAGPGWEIVEDRTWPTGELDPESEKSQRALRAGGITAWRSLGQPGRSRSGWVEVVPYASADDARLSLRQVPRYFVGTTGPDETVVAERVIDDQVLDGVPDTWIFEKATSGPGGTTQARYVAGTVDRILFLTCLSDRKEPWPWGDVIGVARLQAERIGKALGIGDSP